MKEPKEVFKKLEEVRAQTLEILESMTQEALDAKPAAAEGEEEWSLGEVFMHLAIDEIYLRELIAIPLLEGVKPPEGVKFLPPPPPYGTPKDVIEYWFARARLQTQRYFEQWSADVELGLVHHGGLGEMNGLEWFEGYGGHEAFHHKQINDLISGLEKEEG